MPVMVEESVSPCAVVWMMATGVVAGVVLLSLVGWGRGTERVLVIVRPLVRRELSVAVREAAACS